MSLFIFFWYCAQRGRNRRQSIFRKRLACVPSARSFCSDEFPCLFYNCNRHSLSSKYKNLLKITFCVFFTALHKRRQHCWRFVDVMFSHKLAQWLAQTPFQCRLLMLRFSGATRQIFIKTLLEFQEVHAAFSTH